MTRVLGMREATTTETDIVTYMKQEQQFNKLKRRIDKIKDRYNIETSYSYENFDYYIHEKSSKLEKIKGRSNIIETMKKVLLPNEKGKNKVVQAGQSADDRRLLKLSAFKDNKELIEQYLENEGITYEDLKRKYMNEKGKISAKGHRAIRKELSLAIQDEDAPRSPDNDMTDFFQWVHDEYVPYTESGKTMTTREYWDSLTEEEQRQLFYEKYVKPLIKEQDNMASDEIQNDALMQKKYEQMEKQKEREKQNKKKKGGKKK